MQHKNVIYILTGVFLKPDIIRKKIYTMALISFTAFILNEQRLYHREVENLHLIILLFFISFQNAV